MEIISCSLAETADLAEKIIVELVRRHKQNKSATVVGLEGELGSGKTTFVQLAARRLGISDPVQSPTFVIMKSYRIPLSPRVWPWRRLMHIDCYRLSSGEDLLKLGWRDLAADAANLIMIEWSGRVGDLLAAPTLEIRFEVIGENSRKIIYDKE